MIISQVLKPKTTDPVMRLQLCLGKDNRFRIDIFQYGNGEPVGGGTDGMFFASDEDYDSYSNQQGNSGTELGCGWGCGYGYGDGIGTDHNMDSWGHELAKIIIDD